MRLPKIRPRLSLRTMFVLVALVALGLGAATTYWSPAARGLAGLAPGRPEYERRDSAMALGGFIMPWEKEKAVAGLVGALKDPSGRVRESAVAGLAARGDDARPAIPKLIALLNDPDRGPRASAAAALGILADPKDARVVTALTGAVGDPDLDVRLAAAEALLKLGHAREAMPALVDAAAEPEASTHRGRVEYILGRYRPDPAAWIPAFQAACADPDPRRREAALRLLIDRAGAADVAGGLRRARDAKDPDVRAWAAAKARTFAAKAER